MTRLLYVFLITLFGLCGCSTPYSPPVFVKDGVSFPGIDDFLATSSAPPVNVILVHGMGTTHKDWAISNIDLLAKSIDPGFHYLDTDPSDPPEIPGEIQVIKRTIQARNGIVRFTGLIWSPLTSPLKTQLDYDKTLTPTNCASDPNCHPVRGYYNGTFKDNLLDDCLADVVIYLGQQGRLSIQEKMVTAISNALETSEALARSSHSKETGPLVLVTESLGSKIAFDALSGLEQAPALTGTNLGKRAIGRLALVFMGANQLPMLGLADPTVAPPAALTAQQTTVPPSDSLQHLLKISALKLIAFSDPNDLLSWRVQKSRYAESNDRIADILVSNQPTYFRMIENPATAHTTYLNNHDVVHLIACGSPSNTSSEKTTWCQ